MASLPAICKDCCAGNDELHGKAIKRSGLPEKVSGRCANTSRPSEKGPQHNEEVKCLQPAVFIAEVWILPATVLVDCIIR